MTDLKKMTVAASGKLRQVAYDILNEQTRLLSWQQGGKVPQEQFDSLQKLKDFILLAILRLMKLSWPKRRS